MEINHTPFEHIHHSSQIKHDGIGNEDYVLHSLTVYTVMWIDGQPFDVSFQSGNTYIRGDYSTPSNKLTFYYDDSSELAQSLDCLSSSDFTDCDSPLTQEVMASVRANIQSPIETVDDIEVVYDYFTKLLDEAEAHRKEVIGLSTDPKDYEEGHFNHDGYHWVGV